jgi:hypothetical protein
MREPGEQRRGLFQHIFQAARTVGGGDLRVNAGPLVGGDGPHLHQGINKKPEARLGGDAPGTGVG